jgi:hypothetical protein
MTGGLRRGIHDLYQVLTDYYEHSTRGPSSQGPIWLAQRLHVPTVYDPLVQHNQQEMAMHDVDRLYPHVRRRNYKHRARMRVALQQLGVVDHLFPTDFFIRHWRDQQVYIEQILKLQFCARCKIPVAYLEGAICSQCAISNERAWTQTREMREDAMMRSLADKPMIHEEMLSNFQTRNVESKITRMAREFEITEDEARSILQGPESKTSVEDILSKARKA